MHPVQENFDAFSHEIRNLLILAATEVEAHWKGVLADAYQAVKHDRENQFQRATLLNAIQAVCGCAVMLFAQFGQSGFHYRAEINSFFEVKEAPVWHPSETYSSEREGMGYKPVVYPF